MIFCCLLMICHSIDFERLFLVGKVSKKIFVASKSIHVVQILCGLMAKESTIYPVLQSASKFAFIFSIAHFFKQHFPYSLIYLKGCMSKHKNAVITERNNTNSDQNPLNLVIIHVSLTARQVGFK